jgi:hypothetical protein
MKAIRKAFSPDCAVVSGTDLQTSSSSSICEQDCTASEALLAATGRLLGEGSKKALIGSSMDPKEHYKLI